MKERYYVAYKQYWNSLCWRARVLVASRNGYGALPDEFMRASTQWLEDNPLREGAEPPNFRKKIDEIRSATNGKDLYYRMRVEDEIRDFRRKCDEDRFLFWLNTPEGKDMPKWDYHEPLPLPPMSPSMQHRQGGLHRYR